MFNAERYIERCVKSIICQTFKSFELILVDDGSTDNTIVYAEALATIDERVRIIRQKNMGVSSARAAGVRVAQGEWITFVDADDYLCPESLDVLVKNSDGVDLVNASLESTNGHIWQHIKQGVFSREEYMMSLIDATSYANPVAKLFKRGIINEDDFKFPPDVKIGEDVLMNLKIARKIMRVRNIPDIIYYYFKYEDSTMSRYARSVSYFLRYFNIRNQFLDLSQQDYASRYDIKMLIEAFCDPNIPYRLTYYRDLKSYVKNIRIDKHFFDTNTIQKIGEILEKPVVSFVKKNCYYYKNYFARILKGRTVAKVLD